MKTTETSSSPIESFAGNIVTCFGGEDMEWELRRIFCGGFGDAETEWKFRRILRRLLPMSMIAR